MPYEVIDLDKPAKEDGGESDLFDRAIYGAILRQRRIAAGYRKAEDFISDLETIGLSVPKARVYRIERGDQAPPIEFILASNLLLCGDAFSSEIIEYCVEGKLKDPWGDAEIARMLAKHNIAKTSFESALAKRLNETDYESLLEKPSWFDYKVFVNDHTSKEGLFISIADADHDFDDFDPLGDSFASYPIVCIDDIEKAVIQHLKKDNVRLPNNDIKKLIEYAAKVVAPYAEQYSIR